MYKKIIAQMLHHIDQRSGPGNPKFDPRATDGVEGDRTMEHADEIRGTTSQILDVALVHSENHAKGDLRDHELRIEKMSQAQVIAEVLQYTVADMPQTEPHKGSGSTSVGIQHAKPKIMEAEITQTLEKGVVDSEKSGTTGVYFLEASAIDNSLEQAQKIREAASRKLSTSEHSNGIHRDQGVEHKQASKDEVTASDTVAKDEEVKQRRNLVRGDDEDIEAVEELVIPEDLEAGARRDMRRKAVSFFLGTLKTVDVNGLKIPEI